VEQIVKRAISSYLPLLETKPIGMPFEKVYDLETIRPCKSWLNIYDKVKEEVSHWGLVLG
jgi:hypothetical protein